MDAQDRKLVGLWLSVFLLLPVTSLINQQTSYRCGSCGSGGELGQSGLLGDDVSQASGSVRNVTRVEGDAKERALEKSLNSKDFKILAKVLAGMGYEPTLEDAAVLEIVKTTAEKEIDYFVVGMYFVGDAESRTIVAVISLEPVQEALAFRLDNKTQTLELLAEVRKGEVEWVRNSSYRQSTGRPLTLQSCPPCHIPIWHCTTWNWGCIVSCCGACQTSCILHVWAVCLPCLLIWCPICTTTCCSGGYWDCVLCQGGNCYNMQYCHSCPGCGG
jgi:hypothetical protein